MNEARKTRTRRRDGEALLRLVGRYCDADTLPQLRLTCLTLHNEFAPTRAKVDCGSDRQQLHAFALHVHRHGEGQRLTRVLRHLTLLGCAVEEATVTALTLLKRELKNWAPRLAELELELEQRRKTPLAPLPSCTLADVLRHLRWRVGSLSLKLVQCDGDLELCNHATQLTVVSPRTYTVAGRLRHLKRLVIESSTERPAFWCVGAPTLEEFSFSGSALDLDLWYLPDSVKKLSLPLTYLKTDQGRALLDRCGALEELTIAADDDEVICDQMKEIITHCPDDARIKVIDDDSSLLFVEDRASWVFLHRFQDRLALEDLEWKVDYNDLPLPDVVLTIPKRVTIFLGGDGPVPQTPTVRRALVRWLRRALPNLEVLTLQMCGDQERVFDETSHPDWQEQLRSLEAEELRASEEELKRARFAWPAREVTLQLEPATAHVALLFPLTPAMTLVDRTLPPADLAVACPGLRTLAGIPKVIARAVEEGIGGLTCLRLLAHCPHCTMTVEKRGTVADVLAAIEKTRGRLQKLQLERDASGGEWWDTNQAAPDGTVLEIV